MDLNDIINASGQGIVSEQNDLSRINAAAALLDKNELLKSGMSMAQIMANVTLAAIRRANLNVRNGKIATFAVGTAGWHELGKVIQQAATSKEALEYAELAGWDLQKVQQYVDFGDSRILTDMFGIVRSDTKQVLGSVGKKYAIVSNEECFDFMDTVIENGARYETAGALGKGEKVWMLARMPEVFKVKGDEVENFILFMTSHDGSTSISVFPTNVRVVCQNTFRMASGDKRKGISFRHSKNVKVKIGNVKRALGISQYEVERFKGQATLLASNQLEPQEYFNAVLDDILDVTVIEQRVTKNNLKGILDGILQVADASERATAEKQLEKALVRRKLLLDDVLERYESERNNGNAQIAGTAWAAWNAVTEHADHSQLWRNNGTIREKQESRFESNLMGRADEIKATALNLAMARMN